MRSNSGRKFHIDKPSAGIVSIIKYLEDRKTSARWNVHFDPKDNNNLTILTDLISKIEEILKESYEIEKKDATLQRLGQRELIEVNYE